MSGLHHSVGMAFGVSGLVREKGYYKTADGARMIRRTRDAAEQIVARYQMAEHAVKSGYPETERYYLTQNGHPYVHSDGENYIMTDLISHAEADFAEPEEFMRIVKAVARWHGCVRGAASSAALHKGRPLVPLTDSFRSDAEALNAIHKRIRKQSKWSDFDVLFIKHYPAYKAQIQRARQLLDSTGYVKRWHKAHQMHHVCHNGLKEDCLRINLGEVYIAKLDHAAAGYQLTDLCSLLRRREKEYGDTDRSRAFEAYSSVLPTEPEEEIILEAMLLYPLAFTKIVLEYYQKKRSWTPVSMENKMLEILGLK